MEISKKHETRVVTDYFFYLEGGHRIDVTLRGPEDTIEDNFIEEPMHYIRLIVKNFDGHYSSVRIPHDRIVYREDQQRVEEITT